MNKYFYLKYLITLLCLIFVLCLIFPLSYTTSEVLSTSKFSTIVINIKDTQTDEPISNATICILDTRQYYYTNKNGYSENIKIPLFDEYQTDDYYSYNLLIYKNGYNDYLYFGLKVKPNQKRTDIIVKLSPIINQEDIETTIYFEPPYQKTINTLIKENKK